MHLLFKCMNVISAIILFLLFSLSCLFDDFESQQACSLLFFLSTFKYFSRMSLVRALREVPAVSVWHAKFSTISAGSAQAVWVAGYTSTIQTESTLLLQPPTSKVKKMRDAHLSQRWRTVMVKEISNQKSSISVSASSASSFSFTWSNSVTLLTAYVINRFWTGSEDILKGHNPAFLNNIFQMVLHKHYYC